MLRILASGLLLMQLAACAVSPTGRQQLVFMPAQEMDAMGVAAFTEIKQKETIATDPVANAYVRCVADAVVDALPQRQPWELVVFQDDAANAFALPGGKIGVYTGMLEVARTQDQLAAVIGHEIGHVLAQHSNERASQNLAVQGGLAVAGAVAGDSGLSSQTMQLLGLGVQVGILLPYSRTHESEADEIGLDLMARAGFDPRGAVTLWRNMAAQGGGAPPELLSTHPANDTRIRDLQARLGPALQTYEAARAQGRRPRCG